LDAELAIAPYVDIEKWCAERAEYSEDRLNTVRGQTILVNHSTLEVEPTHRLPEPDIGLSCGTTATREWSAKDHAQCANHGPPHMPEETRVDGVRHIDVSLGYPFEKHPPHARRRWPLEVMRVS